MEQEDDDSEKMKVLKHTEKNTIYLKLPIFLGVDESTTYLLTNY